MSDNIKVVVKVRPLISRELEDKLSYQWRVKNDTLVQLDQSGKGLGTTFTFDKVYDKETDTSEVYNDVAKPIVEAAIKGFNGTIFAYGQTSSGKTYTMSGTEESPGIIPRAVVDLFERIKQIPDRDFLVRVSYIEIYNETLQDLLNVEKKNIKVHETLQGVKVDCTEKVMASPEEVFEAMKEGEANRQTGATNMNEESSRSHSIFQIIIESREHIEGEEEVGCVNVSQLNLVDLAGSERAGQTGATGIRFKEGTHINKSLSTLALVIKQLSETGNTTKYINYRDSKLTRILQNSLGGNAKTSIICAITPASVEETISTLQFANRAKAIQNKPEVNAVATNATMIQSLTKQLSKLQSQLEGKKNLEQDNANLQKQISKLQKLILNAFSQNRSIDLLSQNRRKMQQLRRVTISTLLPISETEDAVPSIPKFCTPSLKYNPLSLSTSEFLPIPNSSKMSLGVVSEEKDHIQRMVTPPPLSGGGDKANTDEIINLDDSDETTTEGKTCSPYHKCYGQSKTPPCVLRKNAIVAEKNYNSLVEHTEREKIYAPDVVELLQRLEQNADTITKLDEELSTLKEHCEKKDNDIKDLKNIVLKNEEEIRTISLAKTTLEKQCQDLNVKLTDWEVSYETLQKKSKKREEELLLLLDEEKASKKTDSSSRISREMNFMDLSKDISLVNSDTENSVISTPVDVESSAQIKELVSELQAQLSAKTEMILKLESNLNAEKQKIESLESSIIKLNCVIDEYKTNVPRLETEKSLLQATIETLNSTVENQKLHLETTNKDIQSYNSTIQELQIKLFKKEKLPNVKINDNTLETMIANEEKLLANNENMRNIVQSFMQTLESRNEEVKNLKSQIQTEAELVSNNILLKNEIQIRDTQINKLVEEVEKIKDQFNENILIIERLMANEKELSSKLVDAQDQNDTLRKQNKESTVHISDLQKTNGELTNSIEEIKSNLISTESKLEKCMLHLNDFEESNVKLNNVIDELNSKLCVAENEISVFKTTNDEKVTQISQLDKMNKELNNIVTEKEIVETEIKTKLHNLSKEYDEMTQKIIELQQEKHDEISRQSNFEERNAKYLVTLKSVLLNVQDILFSLGNNTWVFPEHAKDIEEVLSSLTDGMTNVKIAFKQILEERNMIIQDNIQIKKEKSAVETNYENYVESSKNDLKCLQSSKTEIIKNKEGLEAQVTSLNEKIITAQQEIDSMNEAVANLKRQVIDEKENCENLRNSICSKDGIIVSLEEQIFESQSKIELLSNDSKSVDLQNKISDLMKQLNEKEEHVNLIQQEKDTVISLVNARVLDLEGLLETKQKELCKATEELNKATEQNIAVMNDVLNEVLKLFNKFNLEIEPLEFERTDDTLHETIVTYLDKLSKCILTVKSDKHIESNQIAENVAIKKALDQAKQDIAELTEKNIQIMDELSVIERKNQQMLTEYQSVEDLSQQLMGTSDLLSNLKSELASKAREIAAMEKTAMEWKEQFLELQSNYQTQILAAKASELMNMENKAMEWKDQYSSLQEQILELQLENNQLKTRLSELIARSEDKFNSPPTLTTICARNIIEAMRPDDNMSSLSSATSKSIINTQDAQAQINTCNCAETTVKPNISTQDAQAQINTCNCAETTVKLNINTQDAQAQINTCDCAETTVKPNISTQDAQAQIITCDCAELQSKLSDLMIDNMKLVETLQQVESANNVLLEEQERVREEIQLLIDPVSELQKKLLNHKTNLSTLTATTYAENKLLETQLKVLKHHHTRYINVCQRDIPNFKTQLCELMLILKDNESFMDKNTICVKRYSLPDIRELSMSKNESTLDGDLLMLDTNLTLTSADSTLMVNDQTCLDLTQANIENEVTWENVDTSKAVDMCSQIEDLQNDNKQLVETLNELKDENIKLRVSFERFSNESYYSSQKESQTSIDSTYHNCDDSISNPSAVCTQACENCKDVKELLHIQQNMTTQIEVLSKDLEIMKIQKCEMEKKYADLTLEIPATDTLLKRLNNAEHDLNAKIQEILKLNSDLDKKAKFIKDLQQENDQLSTEVMETISEVDDLKKELDSIKELYAKQEQLAYLQKIPEATQTENYSRCSQCSSNNDIMNSLQTNTSDVRNLSLNRSLSDSHSTSRLNKICTLQNELYESKEDCKKITEDVVTVKNFLERSNFSMCMDLDESVSDVIIPKESYAEQKVDLYTQDKLQCMKFCIEKTGQEKENFNCNVKIIDIIKSFYNILVSKHGEEIENLTNKLQEFQDSERQLQIQFNDMTMKYENINKELEFKDHGVAKVIEIFTNMKTNIDLINEEIITMVVGQDTTLVTKFKESILSKIDSEFNISSASTFESLINAITTKNQTDLDEFDCRYKTLQTDLEKVNAELNAVNDELKQVQNQLTARETEYNLLNSQKLKIQEISNAVTLDIVNKEREIQKIINLEIQHLVENNIIGTDDVDITLPVNEKISQILQKLRDLKQHNVSLIPEKDNLKTKVIALENAIEQKDVEITSLKNSVTQKELELSAQISANEDRDKLLQRNLEQTKLQLGEFENATKQTINVLKDTISEKEHTILHLEGKINELVADDTAKNVGFVQKIEELLRENDSLKSVNTVITKEKEQVALELEKCNEVINVKKAELDKLTADTIKIRETVNENVSIIETLTTECKALHEQNELLKSKVEEKAQICGRLELNIKTMEKTAEVQTKIISRLHKQKEEDDQAAKEKDERFDELTQKCLQLKKDYENVSDTLQIAKVEIEELKVIKKELEERIMELEIEAEANQNRPSIDVITENSRRRRQSLHDSKRIFADNKPDFDEHHKIEAMFDSRSKPDDLFMDAEGDSGHSNRSTPLRHSRGRDSLPKQDTSDHTDEPHSRPSSVLATRRRRQSIHDLHRSALRHTPSPHDQPRLLTEPNLIPEVPNPASEVTTLRDRLTACQQELDELKERYRELDEECETCAEYLHERDAQCVTLKKEKKALEEQVTALNARLKANPNASQAEPSLRYADASVNTDEDWANLHSVVVDRMSFDAEVEKNKKLTRTIEELRYKNQDLKNTLQKAMDKYSSHRDARDLEMTKSELRECREELEELKEKYKELDEECETCAQYLRDRDEQCRKLKEAKANLEAKLLEYEGDMSSLTQSTRKKRQSLHDQNRTPGTDFTDVHTETSEDFLSSQVERDVNSRSETDPAQAREVKQLKHALDKLLMEKSVLEHKLMAIHPTMFVATGSAIVQNQQITDVMKENQKLKRINAKLVDICRKRGKSQDPRSKDNRENEDPGHLN